MKRRKNYNKIAKLFLVVLLGVCLFLFLEKWTGTGNQFVYAQSDNKQNEISKAKPGSPKLIYKSALSIWVNPQNDMEYGIRISGSKSDYKWQKGNLFFGLSEHTTYEIVQRYEQKTQEDNTRQTTQTNVTTRQNVTTQTQNETDSRDNGTVQVKQSNVTGVTTQSNQATQQSANTTQTTESQLKPDDEKISTPLIVTTDSWSYTLRYACNGGENHSQNVLHFRSGQGEISLISPERTGYLFDGWYLESSYKTRVTAISPAIAKDQHIYAKWVKVSKAKVTGVKVTNASGNKINCTYKKRNGAQYYEVQYSTSSTFTGSQTVTVKTNNTKINTDALTPGRKYYFRVRAVAFDSKSDEIYGSYSSVKTKTVKASQSGTANSIVKGAKKRRSGAKVYQKKTQYVMLGEKITLVAPPKVKKGSNTLHCKTSNKKVVKISKKGEVTTVKAGKATVYVQRGKVKYKYKIVVEEVDINESDVEMIVGDKLALSLSGNSKKPVFSSSDKCASVSKNGTVTAKTSGKATITAKYRGHEYTCNIKIITQEQKKIDNVSDFYFKTIHRTIALSDGPVSLQYEVYPVERSSAEIAWYSSNPSVAVVQNGIVTPIAPGKTEISVKYSNGGSAKMMIEVLVGGSLTQNIRTVCHRGGKKAPENSLAAFKKAAEEGYEYVETDIRWTKDNVPVLIHDATVNRTSDAVENLNVSDLTYEECLKLDFSKTFGEEYKNTKIVRFDAFLNLCRERNLKAYVELKGSVYYEKASLLASLVRHYDMADKVTWISFSKESLKSVEELMPTARLGYLSNNLTAQVIEYACELKNSSNNVFLDLSYSAPYTLDILRLAGNSGLEMECYTIDDMTLAKNAISQGAVGITTNSIAASDIKEIN